MTQLSLQNSHVKNKHGLHQIPQPPCSMPCGRPARSWAQAGRVRWTLRPVQSASCSLNGIRGSGGLCGCPSPRSVGVAAGAAHGWGGTPGTCSPFCGWAMGAAGGCRCPGRCGAPGGLPLGGFVALQLWSKLVSSVLAPQPELCAPALEQGSLLVTSVQAETRHGLSLKGCYWFYFILTSFREILSVLWVYWYVSTFAY